jgi:RNA polymerase sigma-70 factor (ECF subfamily)
VAFGSDFSSTLAAARTGAEWAWTALYREYSPAVLRYLKARGAHEPDDLLGEVFVQVVRNITTFEGGESEFRTWVFLVARNRLIDERRHSDRNPVDPAANEMLVSAAGHGHVEAEAMERLERDRVMVLLDGLTADQRDVLFLRLFARLTVDEVARVMGKTPGAVKQLQARGLAQIRKEIAE